MRVTVSNPKHPDYGVATIPLPIPDEQYNKVLELLEPLEIGSATKYDCKVESTNELIPALDCLFGQVVNLDELDYLAKRLDSFTKTEMAQFQGMAATKGYTMLSHLINLTFSCQQATVITDFSDLGRIGREHYLNTHGGCAPTEELDNLDAVETAILLIADSDAFVTPYGVVYDNGMKLAEVYDGKHFPSYHYKQSVMEVGIRHKLALENEKMDWVLLPAPSGQLYRAMERAGASHLNEINLYLSESELPEAITQAMDIKFESLTALNSLCEVVMPMNDQERTKLAAAVRMAEPQHAFQIYNLAKNLDLFQLAPGVKSAEEYAKYMIMESGRFDYDENLHEYYNFEKYGRENLEYETGDFNEFGYISYHGALSLDELMMEGAPSQCQQQGIQMGGM